MATFERDEFAKHVNSNFQLPQVDPKLDLRLVEVSDLIRFPGQESFSLILHGPKERLLPQGTNRFHHEVLGDFDIFTVPIREDATGIYYQAVFNRLVDKTTPR